MKAGRKCIRTEQDILARCDEVGDCLLWRGAVSESGCPKADVEGKSWNVRNLLFCQFQGRALSPGRYWQPKCGNMNCLAEGCLTQVTRAAIQQRIAKREAGTLLGQIKRQRCAREGGLVKLDWPRANRIRMSQERNDQLAQEYGVHIRTIARIKAGQIWKPIASNSIFNLGG